jgi:hypothetical protein
LARTDSHRSLLQFIRRILDVPLGYSQDNLLEFRSIAARDYPSVVPVIEAYLDLTERARTDIQPAATSSRKRGSKRTTPGEMHLFDLLRERQLFPSNSDLAEFAMRVLPNMTSRRFDKMSRGDIAGRIIEHLESRDPRTREALEASMRDAMKSGRQRPADRRSFLSQWEKIIKGIDL